uniref:FRIGIDA-like protein n=1 Tax=Wollemia nobilis TaxID=56998 RepID=A0A0C9RXX4_9CONI
MSVADISAAMDAVAAKKESLRKAYLELESHSSALVNFKIQWKELQDQFDSVEELLKKRCEVLGIEAEEIKTSKPLEANGVKEEVKARPEFKSLCEKMNAEGLKNFLVENKRDLAGLRNEAPAALRAAPKPAELVLRCLEGFYSEGKGEKDEALFVKRRRAAVLVLETLPAVVKEGDVPAEAKKAAKKLAEEWKEKMKMGGGDASGNYLEAHAFLQLLASYGIAKEFKDDFVRDCVVAVSGRKQAPELCRTLGLSGKMSDIIEKLISSGKQIDAVKFAHAFGLVEKFPPVPLLKAYLKNSKKLSQETAKNGKNAISAQNEGASKEIAALKAVIKCIQEHKLESQMNVENLEQRVANLEKSKADRKRNADAVKSQQTKRPRVNSGGAAASTAERTPATYASSSGVDRSFFRSADRPQYPGLGTGITSYNLTPPGQGAYDRSSQGIYGSAYSVGSRSDVLPRSQLYPSESLQPSLYGAGSFGASSNYSSFNLGSGLPPAAASYPPSYLR